MPRNPNESDFEIATIQRLERLGYTHLHGGELRECADFPLQAVVFSDVLHTHLKSRYGHLPPEALDLAVQTASDPQGVDLLHRNLHFHQILTRGFELPYTDSSGQDRIEHIYLVNWENPTKNDFHVISQLSISGHNDRRPDLIVAVNGLPLVVFELKSPYDEYADVAGAFNQIQHYQADIPQLFDFNTFCVLSDNLTTLHGVHSATMEWFAPWKSIDGRTTTPGIVGTMRALIEGLFPKDRLLEYIRQFIVFEVVNDVVTKKGAKYHQFFGVRFAAREALRATAPDGDRRIGVIWHTQGSGKSLSMVFFVGLLGRWMENPLFLVEVDRTDLDEQLTDAFQAATSLLGTVDQAEDVPDLRKKLRTRGGGVILSTIEKFRLLEGETQHPVLNERRDIIVIADEAHRTQYGLLEGYAYHLRKALPHASFIGFTGTPIEETNRSITSVFGTTVHTYDLIQAKEDNAVVAIYYEPRLVELENVNPDIDEDVEEITETDEQAGVVTEKWATIEKAAGTKERMQVIAQDILSHFEERNETIFGKALIVGMSRRNCVTLYDEIIKLRPEWHDKNPDKGLIKVVMTGNISKDPVEWNQSGHLTTKRVREKIKARLRDPDDALKMVIVRDMWLTGTDLPCLHTMYVDKPMKGHSLIQAITRVNRVFRDKTGGLVVDYIGIGGQLKAATRTFTSGGTAPPAENLDEVAEPAFYKALEAVQELCPVSVSVDGWRGLEPVDKEDLFNLFYGTLLETDEIRDTFLKAEKGLSSAYSLVKHLDGPRTCADEVAFYQLVRKGLLKTIPGAKLPRDREQAVHDLLDESIASGEAVDIYAVAGIPKPDISILDEAFLEEFTWQRDENLRVRLLNKLLADEIQLRRRKNLQKYTSFRNRLEKALSRYHANALTSAEIIQIMIEIRQAMTEDDARKEELGLSDEELAFYDAIVWLGADLYEEPFLADLVKDITQAVKRNLKVDWTKPHREDVQSAVRAAVKMVLRRKKVKREQFDRILESIFEQAVALYEEWPVGVGRGEA